MGRGDLRVLGGVAAAPTGFGVSADGGDYSRAVLTWRDGSNGAINGFWFKVERRASGDWRQGRWVKVEQRGDGNEKFYRHVVAGLDPAAAHDFRVAGQQRDCQPTAWSGVATLSPPAPPAAPEYTATIEYGGGSAALVVTPANPPGSVTSYSVAHRVKDSGDEFTVTTASKSAAASGIQDHRSLLGHDVPRRAEGRQRRGGR